MTVGHGRRGLGLGVARDDGGFRSGGAGTAPGKRALTDGRVRRGPAPGGQPVAGPVDAGARHRAPAWEATPGLLDAMGLDREADAAREASDLDGPVLASWHGEELGASRDGEPAGDVAAGGPDAANAAPWTGGDFANPFVTAEPAAPVQLRREQGGAPHAGDDAHAIAAAGTCGPGEPLPHGDAIQRSFGRHDIGGVQAHTGGEAARAAGALGAEAFATGSHVAFGSTSPSLFTAAHEAAHVIQQRGGVQLLGGLGQAGDAHEHHADAVAARVVAGESAEDLLDAAPRGGAGGEPAIQRRDVGASPAAHNSYEIEIAGKRGGSVEFAGKIVFSVGRDAVGRAGGDRGPLAAEVAGMRPKIVGDVGAGMVRLETALIESGFDVTVFEGLSIGVETSGLEATLGKKGADLTLFKVAVLVKGDVSRWVGLRDGLQAELELEASFAIGGALLAKLAEMAGIQDRIEGRAKRIETASQELDDAHRSKAQLERDRAETKAQRDALGKKRPPAGGIRSMGDVIEEATDPVRHALDRQLRDLDGQIEAQSKRLRKALEEIEDQSFLLRQDAKKLAEVQSTLDGKIGKRLGGRIAGAARERIGKVIAKALPVLNAVSFVMDGLAVVEWIEDWAANDFDLPGFGGGGSDPWGSPDGTTDERKKLLNTEGDGEGGDGGQPRPADQADVASGTGKSEPRAGDPSPATAHGGPGAGGGGDKATADDRALNDNARRLVRAIQRDGGFELNDDQIAAIGAIVPADLTEDELRVIVDRLLVSGERPANVYVMIGMIERIVRQRARLEVRVGGDADRGRSAGANGGAAPASGATPARGKGGKARAPSSKGAKGATKTPPRDQRPVVRLEEVRDWFEVRGGRLVTTEEFEAWKVEQLGVLAAYYGGKRYELIEADAQGALMSGGMWDLHVALRMAEYGGEGEQVERFRFVFDPRRNTGGPVEGMDIRPIEEAVVAHGSGQPPQVRVGAEVNVRGTVLRIDGARVLASQPNEDGSWPIRFEFVVVSAAHEPDVVFDDDDKLVPLSAGRTLRKVLDVTPRGR